MVVHHACLRELLTGVSSFRSRSTTPEGPSKRPREDSEVAIEETTEAESAREPPAPEQAAGVAMVTEAARPGQAPETLSVAPAARLPEATDISGSLLLPFRF